MTYLVSSFFYSPEEFVVSILYLISDISDESLNLLQSDEDYDDVEEIDIEDKNSDHEVEGKGPAPATSGYNTRSKDSNNKSNQNSNNKSHQSSSRKVLNAIPRNATIMRIIDKDLIAEKEWDMQMLAKWEAERIGYSVLNKENLNMLGHINIMNKENLI